MNNKFFILMLVCAICVASCADEMTIPKPKAMLRLEYPTIEYVEFNTDHFKFRFNQAAKVTVKNKNSLVLHYPLMKASIFINYKSAKGRLKKLFSDAKKLSYDHAIKAEGIRPREYVNAEKQVYGAIVEIIGNAASQSQFYVTDSTTHFVTGSLYFYAKPNYDSLYPAAAYLKNDMSRIMETFQWND